MNESFIPLPSGFGAFLALPLAQQDLRGLTIIGIVLLIGIVKDIGIVFLPSRQRVPTQNVFFDKLAVPQA